MAVSEVLPPEYGWVLLVAVVYGFECLVVGFGIAGRIRGKVFTEEYMKQNFGSEHQKCFNEEIKAGGYPDSGSGFYSKNLNYEDWYRLNNGQRAHMNFVEWIASTQIFILIAGLYFPIPTAAVGLFMAISRAIYAIGYGAGGPNGRLIGALLNDFAMLALFVLSVISSIFFILDKEFV